MAFQIKDTKSLLANRMIPIVSKYVPAGMKPTPKQAAFMLLDCKEAGFGGSLGGGKSQALLMDACQFLHIPGYAAILFRRTYSDLSLPGALMDRAHEWFGKTNAKWKDKEKTWVFPTDGQYPSTITFGYMETPKDKYRYQGSEISYSAFDECTQFHEEQYTYMFSRLRYTKALLHAAERMGFHVPLRQRLATNPGNIGHEWVKRRFLLEGQANGRAWIPSGIKDNPYLDLDSYKEMLSELDPVLRQQYIDGNWDVIEGGGQFERSWFNSKIKNREWVRKNVKFTKLIRAWDFAATKPNPANPDPDWTVGALVGLDTNGNYWVLHVARIREASGNVAAFVQETAESDLKFWGDMGFIEIWAEQEGGSSGKMVADVYKKDLMQGYGMRFQKTSGKKEHRARIFSIAAQEGLVYLCYNQSWVASFFDEIELFPNKEVHDDQVDAISLGFAKLKKHFQFSLGISETAPEQKAFGPLKAPVIKEEDPEPDVELSELQKKLEESDAYQASMERGRKYYVDIGL